MARLSRTISGAPAWNAWGRRNGGARSRPWSSACSAALEPDYVVLGGGNATLLKKLPHNARLGNNEDAFKGGFQLWAAAAQQHG